MSCAFQLAAAVIALAAKGALGTANGAVKLDNYTFDKFLSVPGYSHLVKFDQWYAQGEKETEFETLCKYGNSVPNFFIGEVPFLEHGAQNQGHNMLERFKITKEDLPVFYLFNEKNKEGKKYAGAVKAADIGSWLLKNKIRMPANLTGTIEELDQIVKQFMKEKADAVIESAKKLADEEYKANSKAGVYVKIMQKIKEKGDDYIGTETKRVSQVMEGKMSEKMAAQMNDKIKILGIFDNEL
mmetsp:Transcript_12803/g.22311  ORF Transcript_12803/g.22311 Transcript_12803/m.22311 type:complete len:241 (+) Transcript_12803:63-785(+)